MLRVLAGHVSTRRAGVSVTLCYSLPGEWGMQSSHEPHGMGHLFISSLVYVICTLIL